MDKFTPVDDRKVVSAYSLSKAVATQMVLVSVNVMGLNVCVVHPSGILGPYDHALGETTRTVLQIIKGEMPIGMQAVSTSAMFEIWPQAPLQLTTRDAMANVTFLPTSLSP